MRSGSIASNDVDTAYAISSLGQVHLRTGNPELAEPQARHALELLAGRENVLDEIGNVQIVLGRSLLEQGRFDEAAEWLAEAERLPAPTPTRPPASSGAPPIRSKITISREEVLACTSSLR